MKRGLIITLSILLVIVVGVIAFCIINPQLAQQAISSITGVFQEPTQPPTQPPTVPPTQPTTAPAPKLKATADKGTLEVSETAQIEAKIDSASSAQTESYNIRYTSSDENIARVDAAGVVTAMSKGDCTITVSIDGQEDKVQADFKVTDKRIEQLNLLNNYLASVKSVEEFTYGKNKKGKATLEKCIIDDFNGDGSFELLIVYQIKKAVNKAEIVKIENGHAVSYQTDISYANILAKEYDSYTEEICMDSNHNPSIVVETKKAKNKYTEKIVAHYVLGAQRLNAVQTLVEQEPKDIEKDKGSYKKDGKEITRDTYVSEYSKIKTNYTPQETYHLRQADMAEGKFIKAETPVDLGDAYFNRIEWTSSDPKIAKVSEGGVITGVKLGECVIKGKHPVFNSDLVKITVNITDISNEFNAYIKEIEQDTITGENGLPMKLYGYQTLDIDGDTKKELFLYYIGNNSCQIDVVNITGEQVQRKTAISRSTTDGTVCRLDLFKDGMTNSIVLYEGYTTNESNKRIVRFSYNAYSGKTFTNDSSEYKVEKKATNLSKAVYSIGGEEVKEDHFNSVLNRYSKFGDWKEL